MSKQTKKVSATPGPWGVYSEDDLPGQIAIRETNNPNHGRILAVVDVSDNQDEANAHLIAAAPELLEAAKQTIPLLVRLGDFIGNSDKTGKNSLGVRCDVILAIKNAIAKAEGRT